MGEISYLTRKRSVFIFAFFVNVAFLILFVIWSVQYFNGEDLNANHKPTISNSSELDYYLGSYLKDTKNLTIILDFDGVLSPLSDTPDNVEIIPESKNYLKKLAIKNNVNVAVISGRGLDDVINLVGIDYVTYGGNHGLEILYPNGTLYEHEISPILKQNFTKLVKALEEHLAYNGVYVENKRFSLTFHYPTVSASDSQQSLIEKAWKIIEYFGYVPTQGYLALEAGPPVKWTKGEASEKILVDQFGSNWQKYTKAIFVGDTDSDENAMKILKGKGKSFRVFSPSMKFTHADFILPSVDTVALLLKWLADSL